MLDTLFWILISTFGVVYGIFHFFGNRELYHKIKHINGPKVVPLIGNAYYFIGDTEHFLNQIIRMSNIYASPFKVVLSSRVLILTKDLEQIKTILQSPKTAEKATIYDFAKPWVGNGLITAENKIWRIHRKIIQPTFNQKCLQSLVSIFSKNAISLIKAVENKVGGPEFEISPYIAYTSITSICESSMGVSVESEKDLLKFYTMSERIVRYIVARIIRIWLHSDFLFQFSQISKNFNHCNEYIHNFTDKVIQKRKTYLKTDLIEQKEEMYSNKKTTLDFLLELSDNASHLNDKELREQILTLILAGSDTIERTLDFVFLMLAQQSNVQDKVYEEIYNIYGADDPEMNPVKHEDLHHFKYLERVINETMRLFPTVPWYARQVSEDLVLGDCTVPKDCSAAIFVLGLHRDEKIWTDPLTFNPDRFLPENVKKRNALDYIPFSYGTRDCIGIFII